MNLIQHSSKLKNGLALMLVTVGLCVELRAQHTDPELVELRTTVEAASKQNTLLEQKIAQLSQKLESLNSNLVSLSTKLGIAQECNTKLQELVDTHGGGVGIGDEEGLRQKLLVALRDLKQKVSENASLRNEVGKLGVLSEGVPRVGSAATHGVDSTSSSSAIIAVKPELGLAVCTVGSRSGFRAGTPVTVVRGGKVVAKALVSEVRAEFSGLVLNAEESEGQVRVGDSVQRLAGKNY